MKGYKVNSSILASTLKLWDNVVIGIIAIAGFFILLIMIAYVSLRYFYKKGDIEVSTDGGITIVEEKDGHK